MTIEKVACKETKAKLLIVCIHQAAAQDWKLRALTGSLSIFKGDPHELPSNIVFLSLDPASVSAKWRRNPSNDLGRKHECDRQTDCATEKCVGIGGFACTARAIPHQKRSRRLKFCITVGSWCLVESV